jgi:hypothetical protein
MKNDESTPAASAFASKINVEIEQEETEAKRET